MKKTTPIIPHYLATSSNYSAFIVLTERPLVAENTYCACKIFLFCFTYCPFFLYHYLVFLSFLCPSVWCFFLDSLSAKVLSAVGLLCVFQPLMFSCTLWGGKVNVYSACHCLSSSIYHRCPIFCRSPQSVYCLSLYQHLVLILPFYILYLPRSQFLLLSGPLLSTIHPPQPLSLLSPLPPFPPSHPLPHSLFPLLAFLCSGPIGSHYIDGPDDSVEWCTLFPSASPRPFPAVCSCSSIQQR